MTELHPIIFQPIFGDSWANLPPVMHKHYANRAHTTDLVTVEGTLDVVRALPVRLMSPLLKKLGMLVPYSGINIPTTVHFKSNPANSDFNFHRYFHFPHKKPFLFHSCMTPMGGNEIVEWMVKGTIGWHASFRVDGNRVLLEHHGYKFRLGKRIISLPVTWLAGKGYAYEETIDENRFRMFMEMRHPLFGQLFSYRR